MIALESSTVYVVRRYGIYPHEVIGVFATEAEARDTADRLAVREPDGWHSYVVTPYELNKPLEQTGWTSSGPDFAEPSAVYEQSKQGALLR